MLTLFLLKFLLLPPVCHVLVPNWVTQIQFLGFIHGCLTEIHWWGCCMSQWNWCYCIIMMNTCYWSVYITFNILISLYTMLDQNLYLLSSQLWSSSFHCQSSYHSSYGVSPVQPADIIMSDRKAFSVAWSQLFTARSCCPLLKAQLLLSRRTLSFSKLHLVSSCS
jgi:hypothetical protein